MRILCDCEAHKVCAFYVTVSGSHWWWSAHRVCELHRECFVHGRDDICMQTLGGCACLKPLFKHYKMIVAWIKSWCECTEFSLLGKSHEKIRTCSPWAHGSQGIMLHEIYSLVFFPPREWIQGPEYLGQFTILCKPSRYLHATCALMLANLMILA